MKDREDRLGAVILPGDPLRLGATPVTGGVNFALFAEGADRVDLCLFAPGQAERVLTLPVRSGPVWHGFVPGLMPGAHYGYRVHGGWDLAQGQRFNPAKLLIDPYARGLSAPLRWHPLMQGGTGAAPDPQDSAAVVPKAIVTAPARVTEPRPAIPWPETVIYEAHPKGATMRHPDVPEALRGRFEGLASPAFIAHLQRLGITTLELLPCQAFLDDRFLVEKGLSNYWGYQPVGFFAPEPRYGGAEAFRTMVATLHAAGIEVIVDVVFNHSGEGDAEGPTLSLRGISNAAYYRLGEAAAYLNDTGTGNTLDLAHPFVLRMVLDCLRHWVEDLGVDGFRFDLAATLGRGRDGGFDPEGPFLAALLQDPVLSRVKLIAEPWDIGPGGYRLGGFPWPFAEWNDRFRDGVRRFWRRDQGHCPELARRISGSADYFDTDGREAWASVNFLTAHDGFTLEDVVRYATKRNEANGEGNRDGHEPNFSEALNDPAARVARKRAMLATLMVAQGVPMLLAGDEFGNSQQGNNNAYAQDNETGWLDWSEPDEALIAFTARLTGIRRAHRVLRQRRYLHARHRLQDGMRDLIWRLPSGAEPEAQDWTEPGHMCLCLELRGAAEGVEGEADHEAIFAILNADGPLDVQLPDGVWRFLLDTARPDAPEAAHSAAATCVSAQSVQLFVRRTGANQE